MSDSQARRWYDRDPVMSKAVRILETSEDNLQIQIALNLIKVIIEHNIENNNYATVDEIIASVEDGKEYGNGRWYDLDDTLRTAMQLLKTCSDNLEEKLSKEIANVVMDSLNKYNSEPELDL